METTDRRGAARRAGGRPRRTRTRGRARARPPAPTAWTRAATTERTRFAATHPNELYRLYGSDAAARASGTTRCGISRGRRAYADKYSQHRISLMYWHGAGVAARPRAGLRMGRPGGRAHVSQLPGAAREDVARTERGRAPARAARGRRALRRIRRRRRQAAPGARASAQSKRQITGSHLGYIGCRQPRPRRSAIDLWRHWTTSS